MKKKTLLLSTLLLVSTLTFGCGNSDSTASQNNGENQNAQLTVGVTGGPHEEIMNKTAELAAAQGLDVEVIVFSDYIQPNTQLAEGELDLNAMQHLPYLENTIAEKDYDLTSVGENILIPMCILSEEYTALDQIPNGALIGLPNDTTNEARALALLQSAGLIELDPAAGIMATPKDITANPKNLEFHELNAEMLLRALPEYSAAVVNSNYVVEAGLIPNEEALFVESTENNPWVNIFACRSEDKDNANIQKLIAIYQSETIADFITERYTGDAVIPAWTN